MQLVKYLLAALLSASAFGQIINPGGGGGGGAVSSVNGQTGAVVTPQTSTTILAVAGTPEVSRANTVCSATDATSCIQAAINACPSTVPAASGTLGCRIVLLNGVFNISSTLYIDTDFVSLEGEAHCMWNGYLGVWGGTGSPAGTVGKNCSQIKQLTTGTDVIEIQHNNLAGTGYNGTGGDAQRHRGIQIKWLYLVGYNYTGTAIKSVCGTNSGCKTITTNGVTSNGYSDDNCFILDNIIQNVNDGINVVWDTPDIEQNSIQSINGNGIISTGSFGKVTNNLVFDIGGSGVLSNTDGQVISNNIIGSTNAYGLYAVNQFSAVGNQFFVTRTGAVKVVGGSNSTISGNVINYGQSYGSAPTGDAISIDSSSAGVAVTGNSLYTSASIGGYAINDQGGYGSVSGNSVVGQWNNNGVVTSVAPTNQTLEDSGSAAFYTFANGSVPGFRYYFQDSTQSGNKPFFTVADGSANGIIMQSYSAAYSKPTISLSSSAGGSLDVGNYRSIQTDNANNIYFQTINGSSNGALTRFNITGGQTLATVSFPNSFLGTTIGSAVASASTIAPTGQTFHVTGTTAITTMTPPTGYSSTIGGQITLIADAAWTLSAGTGAGQFKSALTASAGVPYSCTYDGTLWYCK